MDNKKVSNLLRSIADLMDETTSTVVDVNKEVFKTVEKVQEDFLSHSLKLMKRIEDNDAVRAYQNKLTKTDKTLKDALEQIQKVALEYPSDYKRITEKVKISTTELQDWKKVADNMYFPKSEKLGIYLQQDNFLDKELVAKGEGSSKQEAEEVAARNALAVKNW